MDGIREYANFLEFYNDCKMMAEKVKQCLQDADEFKTIAFARKFYKKEILNNSIIIGALSEEIKLLLDSKTYALKFSVDNMIKNQIAHPEVTITDYQKIPKIVKNPSKFSKSKNGYDAILFKEDEKYYKLVIKTTKNKDENFIKSLHLLNKDRFNKY